MLFRVSATFCYKVLPQGTSLNGFLFSTEWVYKDYFSAKNGIMFLRPVYNPADKKKRYSFQIYVYSYKQTWNYVKLMTSNKT